MKYFFFFLATIIVSSPSAVKAKEFKMLFWYPGEAGSTAEAQPMINLFASYISSKMVPDRVVGVYYNTVEGGKTYIKRSLPDFGIISYEAWLQYQHKISGAETWLATLPLPHGQQTEQYKLVGKGELKSNDPIIYIGGSASAFFIREQLFPQLPKDSRLVVTQQLLSMLKSIGEGTTEAHVILTPLEAETLNRLSAPWAKSFATIALSLPIPTARVILFNPRMQQQQQKLKEVLLGMNKDPTAQEILKELRLKGFAEH